MNYITKYYFFKFFIIDVFKIHQLRLKFNQIATNEFNESLEKNFP